MHTSRNPGVSPGLVDVLVDVRGLANELGCEYVNIGGVAVSMLSTPRYTQDVDAVFMFDVAELPRLIDAASRRGLIPTPGNPIAFAEQNRVLPLRHMPSGVSVDISFGVLPFEAEMVERAATAELGGITLRLPTA